MVSQKPSYRRISVCVLIINIYTCFESPFICISDNWDRRLFLAVLNLKQSIPFPSLTRTVSLDGRGRSATG